ncbi:MAG: N-acetyltransferase family protein [Dehalococcoidia bacterium]
MTAIEGLERYPRQVRLGAKDLTIRLMAAGDEDRMLALARSLPEHDLLFLARDITKRSEVKEWVKSAAAGEIATIVALSADAFVGYAAVHRNPMRWSSHVAELRVMVAPEMRGSGLGRQLTQEAFATSLALGVEKMIAQMTLDQKGAIAVFEGLGFRPEALLRDHVKDRSGTKHDLLMLSHEVARFEAQRAAFGVAEAFGN